MESNAIQLHIEALIFASETGVSIAEIREVLSSGFEEKYENISPDSAGTSSALPHSDLTEESLERILNAIENKYQKSDSILELRKINHSYQFLTKSAFHTTINQLQTHRSKKRLSQSAMETLAIIAYRQPITKLEIEHIRGVNCDYSVQRLLEKELISIVGKADTVGKPLLYGTSSFLMDYFGLNDPSELPKMKDIETEENSIGEINN